MKKPSKTLITEIIKKVPKKTAIIAGTSAATTSAIAAPVVTSVVNEKKDVKAILQGDLVLADPVEFNGKHFGTYNQLLDYVQTNAQSASETVVGTREYVIYEGVSQRSFGTYAEVLKYIDNKYVKQSSVYPLDKNNWPKADSIIKEVGSSQFVDTSTEKIYNIYRTSDGKYTMAIKGDEAGDKNARLAAAKTYIQLHNAFFYDNRYFSSKADVEDYIEAHQSDPRAILNKYTSSMNMLQFKNGVYQSFGSFDEVKNMIASNATPMFKDSQGNLIPIDYDHISAIAAALDDRGLSVIPISSNDSQVEQVVDMDSRTPNGQFFGPYITSSGMGVEGIHDPSNWSPASESAITGNYRQSLQEAILSSFIDYILFANDITSPSVLLNSARIDKDSPAFDIFLKSANPSVNYAKMLNDFLYNISQGTRYSTLNAIILSYSFIIDKMIQNRESTATIVTAAKYFDSMAALLDSFLSVALAPAFVNAGDKVNNFHIEYFRSTFKFYDDSSENKVAPFQNDPSSWWRKLIGLDDTQLNNRNIFQLVMAYMGSINSFMKRTNEINETWLKVVDAIKVGIYSANNFGFNSDGKVKGSKVDSVNADVFKRILGSRSSLYHPKDDDEVFSRPFLANDFELLHFDDWSMMGMGANVYNGNGTSTDSDEYRNIWRHLQPDKIGAIDYKVDTNTTKTISNTAILKNFNDFLCENQNQIVRKFAVDVSQFVNAAKEKVKEFDTPKSRLDNFWSKDDGKNLLAWSPAGMMAVTLHTKQYNGSIASATEREKALNSAINAQIPGIIDRLLEFNAKFVQPIAIIAMNVAFVDGMRKSIVDSRARAKAEKEAKAANNAQTSSVDFDEEITLNNPLYEETTPSLPPRNNSPKNNNNGGNGGTSQPVATGGAAAGGTVTYSSPAANSNNEIYSKAAKIVDPDILDDVRPIQIVKDSGTLPDDSKILASGNFDGHRLSFTDSHAVTDDGLVLSHMTESNTDGPAATSTPLPSPTGSKANPLAANQQQNNLLDGVSSHLTESNTDGDPVPTVSNTGPGLIIQTGGQVKPSGSIKLGDDQSSHLTASSSDQDNIFVSTPGGAKTTQTGQTQNAGNVSSHLTESNTDGDPVPTSQHSGPGLIIQTGGQVKPSGSIKLADDQSSHLTASSSDQDNIFVSTAGGAKTTQTGQTVGNVSSHLTESNTDGDPVPTVPNTGPGLVIQTGGQVKPSGSIKLGDDQSSHLTASSSDQDNIFVPTTGGSKTTTGDVSSHLTESNTDGDPVPVVQQSGSGLTILTGGQTKPSGVIKLGDDQSSHLTASSSDQDNIFVSTPGEAAHLNSTVNDIIVTPPNSPFGSRSASSSEFELDGGEQLLDSSTDDGTNPFTAPLTPVPNKAAAKVSSTNNSQPVVAKANFGNVQPTQAAVKDPVDTGEKEEVLGQTREQNINIALEYYYRIKSLVTSPTPTKNAVNFQEFIKELDDVVLKKLVLYLDSLIDRQVEAFTDPQKSGAEEEAMMTKLDKSIELFYKLKVGQTYGISAKETLKMWVNPDIELEDLAALWVQTEKASESRNQLAEFSNNNGIQLNIDAIVGVKSDSVVPAQKVVKDLAAQGLDVSAEDALALATMDKKELEDFDKDFKAANPGTSQATGSARKTLIALPEIVKFENEFKHINPTYLYVNGKDASGGLTNLGTLLGGTNEFKASVVLNISDKVAEWVNDPLIFDKLVTPHMTVSDGYNFGKVVTTSAMHADSVVKSAVARMEAARASYGHALLIKQLLIAKGLDVPDKDLLEIGDLDREVGNQLLRLLDSSSAEAYPKDISQLKVLRATVEAWKWMKANGYDAETKELRQLADLDPAIVEKFRDYLAKETKFQQTIQLPLDEHIYIQDLSELAKVVNLIYDNKGNIPLNDLFSLHDHVKEELDKMLEDASKRLASSPAERLAEIKEEIARIKVMQRSPEAIVDLEIKRYLYLNGLDVPAKQFLALEELEPEIRESFLEFLAEIDSAGELKTVQNMNPFEVGNLKLAIHVIEDTIKRRPQAWARLSAKEKIDFAIQFITMNEEDIDAYYSMMDIVQPELPGQVSDIEAQKQADSIKNLPKALEVRGNLRTNSNVNISIDEVGKISQNFELLNFIYPISKTPINKSLIVYGGIKYTDLQISEFMQTLDKDGVKIPEWMRSELMTLDPVKISRIIGEVDKAYTDKGLQMINSRGERPEIFAHYDEVTHNTKNPFIEFNHLDTLFEMRKMLLQDRFEIDPDDFIRLSVSSEAVVNQVKADIENGIYNLIPKSAFDKLSDGENLKLKVLTVREVINEFAARGATLSQEFMANLAHGPEKQLIEMKTWITLMDEGKAWVVKEADGSWTLSRAAGGLLFDPIATNRLFLETKEMSQFRPNHDNYIIEEFTVTETNEHFVWKDGKYRSVNANLVKNPLTAQFYSPDDKPFDESNCIFADGTFKYMNPTTGKLSEKTLRVEKLVRADKQANGELTYSDNSPRWSSARAITGLHRSMETWQTMETLLKFCDANGIVISPKTMAELSTGSFEQISNVFQHIEQEEYITKTTYDNHGKQMKVIALSNVDEKILGEIRVKNAVIDLDKLFETRQMAISLDQIEAFKKFTIADLEVIRSLVILDEYHIRTVDGERYIEVFSQSQKYLGPTLEVARKVSDTIPTPTQPSSSSSETSPKSNDPDKMVITKIPGAATQPAGTKTTPGAATQIPGTSSAAKSPASSATISDEVERNGIDETNKKVAGGVYSVGHDETPNGGNNPFEEDENLRRPGALEEVYNGISSFYSDEPMDGTPWTRNPMRIAGAVASATESIASFAMALSGGIGAVAGVIIAIAKVVDLINTFENVKTIPYSYQTTDGTTYYWNGAKTTTQFWGLDVEQNYTIKDLKLIDNSVIVSGYSANQQGVYSDGEFYHDLNHVRQRSANQLVKEVVTMNMNDPANWNKRINGYDVVWTVDLANVDAGKNHAFPTIEGLLNYLQPLVTSNTNKKNLSLFSLFDDTLTGSASVTLEQVKNSILHNLKPVIVIRKPDMDDEGLPITSKFALPLPSYEMKVLKEIPTGMTAEQYANEFHKKFVVYNPNISQANLSKIQATDAKDYDYFTKITLSGSAAIDGIIQGLSNTMYIPEKAVLLDQIRQTDEFSKITDHDFEANQSELFSFTTPSGKTRFFTSRAAAIASLANDANLNLTYKDMSTEHYIFDGMAFSTLGEIVQYMKDHYSTSRRGLAETGGNK